MATTQLTRRPDALTSLVLTVPVFLVYHLGILLIDYRNGVDLVTGLTFALLESSVLAYVGATLSIALLLWIAARVQGRGQHVSLQALGPVLLESGLWAGLMLVSVGWATAHLLTALSLAPVMGPTDKLVMAAGAGFHEELVFRVALLSGGRRVLMQLWSGQPRRALLASVVVSSLLFALAHHVGPAADPVEWHTLAFRTLAGGYLAGVYLLRGFAVAVYTHTLYDVLVFFFF